jgi:exodeoxyribonuclease III
VVKIATWNINSIRVRLDAVLDWLEKHKPDVVLFQETKVPDQEFPVDDFGDLGYDAVFHGQRAYNGVAILAKDELEDVRKGLPSDEREADRRLISARIGGVRFVSAYVPHGQSLSSEMYPVKLDWLTRLGSSLELFGAPSEPVVIGGDFNVAPEDIDVWNVQAMEGGTHVSPPEREALRGVLSRGVHDAYREKYPDQRQFTWWDYRSGSFHRDAGLRIDLFLVTQPILDRTARVWVDVETRAAEKSSDHAPVFLELRDE